MRVSGVDGCRGGWLVASVDDALVVSWTWHQSLAAVIDGPSDAIAVDIPIGLADSGSRACDVAARAMAGPRRASVFPAPLRCVLRAASYADARAILAARGGPSMSAQAFGIVRAVADVDAVMTPAMEDRVCEAHPELAFAALAGPLPSKHAPAGIGARVAALATIYPGAAELVSRRPAGAGASDACDALALAWTAGRWRAGAAEELSDGSRDAKNLLMRIVVPQRPAPSGLLTPRRPE